MLFSVCQGLRERIAFDKCHITEKHVSMCVLEIEPWAPQILGLYSTRRQMPKSILILSVDWVTIWLGLDL